MKKIITLLLLLSVTLLSLTSCRGGAEIEKGSGNPLEYGTGACEYADTRDTEGREIFYVEMMFKNYGKVLVLLDKTTAPKTVDHFLKFVNDGFYNGLTIHRVQQNFVIQGGDPNGDGLADDGLETVEGEFLDNYHYNNIKHKKGVISMARSTGYNSATSQFFICNADATSSLDGKYASFGYVIKGLSIIDEITADFAKYTSGDMGVIPNYDDQPIIEYIKVVEYTE